MAQVVSYWDDEVNFKEGPFVITCMPYNQYRIECQVGDSGTPALCDLSICSIIKAKWGLNFTKTENINLAREICDDLNDMVKREEIINIDGMWIG